METYGSKAGILRIESGSKERKTGCKVFLFLFLGVFFNEGLF